MKSQQQRVTSKAPYKAQRKAARTAKGSTKLATLYSRLDRTRPGSKESKRIADEIIDAIG